MDNNGPPEADYFVGGWGLDNERIARDRDDRASVGSNETFHLEEDVRPNTPRNIRRANHAWRSIDESLRIRRIIDNHFRRPRGLVMHPEVIAYALRTQVYGELFDEDRERLNRVRMEIQRIKNEIEREYAEPNEENAHNADAVRNVPDVQEQQVEPIDQFVANINAVEGVREGGENSRSECAICLISMVNRRIDVSTCGHVICRDCIDDMFTRTRRIPCPFCRRHLMREDFSPLYWNFD